MNYLFSILFYMIVIPYYYILGKQILRVCNYESSFGKNLIAGFFGMFFIMFPIGFVSQLFHLSWNLYFCIQSIILSLVLVILIVVEFKSKKNQNENQFDLRLLIKQNWVIIVLSLLLLLLSMANQLPYYINNYDDGYYIGKMINSIGAPCLNVENGLNGNLTQSTGIDLPRILNTYELSYAYFASLFHINVPFFCRVTMQFHNYLLFFITYKEFAGFFFDKKYAQYTLLPFSILLISNGYLMNRAFIRSYDLWQLQTAMFYGGNIVRSLSLPVFFMFGYDLINKFKLNKILFMIMITISMFSFSTIVLPNLIFTFFILLLIKLFLHALDSFKEKDKKFILYIVLFICVLVLLLSTKLLDSISFICNDRYMEALNNYNMSYENYYPMDKLFKYGIVIIIGLFVVFRKREQIITLSFVLMWYLIIKTRFFIELSLLASSKYHFVFLRTGSSVQYLILICVGIFILKILNTITKSRYIMNLISTLIIVGTMAFVYINRGLIATYTELGSGMSSQGYSFKRLKNLNTNMVPDIVDEVGEYFNSLPYGNYRVYISDYFTYDGVEMCDESIFNNASNRIAIHRNAGFDNMDFNDKTDLNNMCDGNYMDLGVIKSLTQKYNIKYFLVFNDESMLNLSECGYKVVLNNKDSVGSNYYLMKVQ